MSPSWTTSPSLTLTDVTVPGASASTGISIFIDSRSTTVSPTSSRSPGPTTTFITFATISARISAVFGSRAMPATLHAPRHYPQVRRDASRDVEVHGRNGGHSQQRLHPAGLGPVGGELLQTPRPASAGTGQEEVRPDHGVADQE